MRATGKFTRSEALDRAEAAIEKVRLTKFRDAYPHMLSGGMKMRVAIARAMVLEPDILLMDEPFAALDALTRRAMQQELLSLWQQLRFTVLFVTHSIEEAMVVGSRILVLTPHPGRVRAERDADGFGFETMDRTGFGEIERPLPLLERIVHNDGVQRVGVLLMLVLCWELYARWLDHTLLFPTFTETMRVLAHDT